MKTKSDKLVSKTAFQLTQNFETRKLWTSAEFESYLVGKRWKSIVFISLVKDIPSFVSVLFVSNFPYPFVLCNEITAK